MLSIIEDLIEVLYMYKMSKMYYFHIAIMAGLLFLNIHFFLKQR